MDDNKFRSRPDGNGSGARSEWAERVSLPDHLRPPLPRHRSEQDPSTSAEEGIELPLVDPDIDVPETALPGGILPESDARDEISATASDSRTTPPDTVPVPAPGPDGEFDLEDPDLYLNRELTWLNFNYRVLAEAEDERVPLLERLKFVAIVSSNLDEFFMKRIGGLKQQVGAGVVSLSVDGRSPQAQIDESYAIVRDLEARKRVAFLDIVSALTEHDVVLANHD